MRATKTPERRRAERQRDPDRFHANEAVAYAKLSGKIPLPTTCMDCGGAAREYDHYLGYAPEHKLDVQPVCRPCHSARGASRRTNCTNGHSRAEENIYVKPNGDRECRICAALARARFRWARAT